MNFVKVSFDNGDYHVVQTNSKMEVVKIAIDSRDHENIRDEDIIDVIILKPEDLV